MRKHLATVLVAGALIAGIITAPSLLYAHQGSGMSMMGQGAMGGGAIMGRGSGNMMGGRQDQGSMMGNGMTGCGMMSGMMGNGTMGGGGRPNEQWRRN